MRLTCTTSKPPEPSPRSAACGVDDDVVARLGDVPTSATSATPGRARRGRRRRAPARPVRRRRPRRPPAAPAVSPIPAASSSSSARVTSSMPSSAATADALGRLVVALGPVGEVHAREARRPRSALASDAAAGDDAPRRRSRRRAAPPRRRRTARRRRAVAVAVRTGARPSTSTSHAQPGRWRRRGSASTISRDDAPRPSPSSSERASPRSVQCSGDDVGPAAPPRDRADVRGRLLVDAAEAHRGDRRAAATIALRPSSGRMPACAACAVEARLER